MPCLPVKTSVDPNQMTAVDPKTGKTIIVPPDGFTPIDGATKSIPHQFFRANGDGTFVDKFDKFGKTKFFELEMKENFIKLHPDYAPTKVWGFDGQVPGPLVRARYGEPVMMRYHNHLPSVKAKQAFGIAEISPHLHNGHTPSESDGNPVNYFNSVNDPNAINPHGYKDQHYPNVYAGFTARGDLVGDAREALSSLWFHDHHLDFTAQNVYKGMFGCYDLFDDLDTGVPGSGLNLPCGEFDVPISSTTFCSITTASWSSTCSTWMASSVTGLQPTARSSPTSTLPKQRYQFRLYAPGPSRWWEWSLWDGRQFWPFWQISTDGNLLPNAVQVTSVRLSVAERVDIIVDFAKVATTGVSRLYLVNRAEQVNGRGPTGKTLTPGTPILQINLVGEAVRDDSADPSVGAVGPAGMKLRDLPDVDFAALNARAAKARVRTWRFERGGGGWTVNGRFFDENVVSAAIPQEFRRGLGDREPRWLLASPSAYPLRGAPNTIPQRRGGENRRPAQRRDRLLASRRDQPANQRRGPPVHALSRHEGPLRHALPQRGA